MANEQNLTPFTSDQNREEAAKNGHAGGIASGEARRRKRDIRLALESLLEKEYKGKDGKFVSGAEAIAIKQMEKALKGDTKAFEVVRDTVGQKPTEKIVVSEVDQNVIDEVERMVNGVDENRSGSLPAE